jgi:enediyne biosynthesis protein E4
MRVATFALAIGIAALGGHSPQPGARSPFLDLASPAGLVFAHDNGARGSYHLPEIMGSGVGLIDYDGDGDLDVYLVQGRPLDGTPGRGRGNRLFRNDTAPGPNGGPVLRFIDVTERAHVGIEAVGMGVAVGDYDGDGHPDMYVTAVGSNTLFHNNGDGSFTDVTREAGVDDDRWSTSAAFVDADRDGDLDLFVVNYVAYSPGNNKVCADPVGTRDYCAPASYAPVPSRLFRNDHGHFTDISETSGITRAYGAGLGVATGDFDGDGWLDLFVANDATPNQLWINRHDGTFEDRGVISGTAFNAAGRPEGSMGIAVGDADDDGDEDLVVTNLIGESHALYLNDGRGNFEDARARAGLLTPTAAMTGFGTVWIDEDNDGRLDLVTVNGAVNILERQRGEPMPYRQRMQLFHNDGGLRFRDISVDAGLPFQISQVGRGAAAGDLDNDGDVDLVVTTNGGAAMLLVNQTVPAHRGVLLELQDPTGPNRAALGALVTIERQDGSRSIRRVRTDGSYLSAVDPRVHVGLDASAIANIVVTWPDAARERFAAPGVGPVVRLVRGTGMH